MKKLILSVLTLATLTTAAMAVYAPIPEQEQGKALSFRLGASVSHDSNIFGAATNEIDSMVYNVSPSIVFNSSVSDQTFVSASYELSLDHMVDRPGSKDLTSHSLSGRVAHSFNQSTNIDLSDSYLISKNPQSLLAGVPLNTDQSFKRNEFDARFTTSAGQKTGVTVKYRNVVSSYDNDALATSLDRMEQLAGVELSYALLPETKLVGEYRYQNINYDQNGGNKDKQSHFLLGGVDYTAKENLTLTGRAGFESRSRDAERDTTVPYLELRSRYAYADGSFLAAGYAYTLEEPSDVVRFTDTKVNRFFVNVQHRLTGAFTASGSLTYEPSQLQGRRGFADIDETTTRFGLGLSWVPGKNWTVTGTYDVDNVSSDDPNRDQQRNRIGVSARVLF
ncbi:MAG: outer membrane beta-barrel protein [Opitutae bacterium]|nr:outer membrane beta-barrel protein [Opitutae bacterium]